MKKSTYIIGVMSGTSLDGIDLAYVKINKDTNYSFDILHAITIPYTKDWQQKLKNAFNISAEEITKLDASYSLFLSGIIQQYIEEQQIEDLDLIATHGHTIFHNPTENYTLQIGNKPAIISKTEIKTICDFRIHDVALGGQGAPLVPIGDMLLFSEYTYCLNIGGFANISHQNGTDRMAYDICPTNIVMNEYMRKLGKEYDDKGQLAATGTLNTTLLNELNALPFYTDKKPKSLGYEFVVDVIFPILHRYNLSTPDILRTYIEHCAIQIASKTNNSTSSTLLITGGGAFNTFLVERIQSHTKTTIILPDESIINYKEALIFAFLGYLRDQNEINCLKSVTGATKNHSGGIIYTT
ncbi:MAG: anhydro-N-acetylmuramic acid kinase [Flavobacteriaceae bacterium]|nr:MAG: anhydro-N-acetylmuramic acid kinase [Flavobacteriaceae bacterium]